MLWVSVKSGGGRQEDWRCFVSRVAGDGTELMKHLPEWKKVSGKTGRKRGDIFTVKNRCTLFDATHSSNRQNFLIQSIVGRCTRANFWPRESSAFPCEHAQLQGWS